MTKKIRTNLLLNWYATPYHTPLFVAQQLGFFENEGVKLALFEPTDPSDVTEAVGVGAMDMGLKAMIHTLAARGKGFSLVSLGTLLDEPPTGFLALKSSGIQKFQDISGKKIGYVGEFGKKILDDLARLAGIEAESYETVRVGMNVTDAILRGKIDAGIGTASDASIAIELGADAILLNRAIARSKNPVLMAEAMKEGCQAGRKAYLVGRMPRSHYAVQVQKLGGSNGANVDHRGDSEGRSL